jgi:predicted transposase YdaD
MATREREGKGQPPRHDPGYKSLFSHRIMVEELLRGFVREDWIDRLDFSTLQKVANSFVSGDLRERHSDLIWRLRLRGDDERWLYLYLLLEFQSTAAGERPSVWRATSVRSPRISGDTCPG